MGSHINKDGKFQSDKYPTCPPGKVPLSVEDPKAQPFLWAYADGHTLDVEFSEDLKESLHKAGFNPQTAPIVVRREDLEWALATLASANSIIDSEGLDDDEELDEINERLEDISKRYGLELELDDE